MPADLASDDDPDRMAIALPHPYAPRRPKATAEAQGRRHLCRYLLTSSPSHPLSPRSPDCQPALFCDPRAAGGMRGVPRVTDAAAFLEVPTASSEAPDEDYGFLGVVEGLGEDRGVIEETLADIKYDDFLRPPSRRRHARAPSVLEVPKAPPEPPEREFGFLGVIEDLHQALGVIEPFLRDPRAAGGMRGRPRAMNATPHKERGDYAGTSRGPYLYVYHLEGLSLTPPSSPDDIITPSGFSSNSSRDSTRIQKFACRVNYEERFIAALHATRRWAASDAAPACLSTHYPPLSPHDPNLPISRQEAVYAPLPRPGIDGEVLDFEGGGVGVGGFPTLISRQYYYSQRRAPLGTQ
ncbi:hypothetical protein K525DRAFT_275200 [Schizophyllum commune Loenen D]|nr:hypothetical protein K525DRAFT_275200 [Schizophyllum commune Loenen D]